MIGPLFTVPDNETEAGQLSRNLHLVTEEFQMGVAC